MSTPAAPTETEFTWPYESTEGPQGDCAANVDDYRRLIQAVEVSDIRYRDRIPAPSYVDMIGADIIATNVLDLDDCR